MNETVDCKADAKRARAAAVRLAPGRAYQSIHNFPIHTETNAKRSTSKRIILKRYSRFDSVCVSLQLLRLSFSSRSRNINVIERGRARAADKNEHNTRHKSINKIKEICEKLAKFGRNRCLHSGMRFTSIFDALYPFLRSFHFSPSLPLPCAYSCVLLLSDSRLTDSAIDCKHMQISHLSSRRPARASTPFLRVSFAIASPSRVFLIRTQPNRFLFPLAAIVASVCVFGSETQYLIPIR